MQPIAQKKNYHSSPKLLNLSKNLSSFVIYLVFGYIFLPSLPTNTSLRATLLNWRLSELSYSRYNGYINSNKYCP